MNLINSKWIKYKNVNLKVEKGKDSIIIDNDKNKHAFLICRKIFKKKEKDIIMNFSYKLIHGDKASVVLMNRKKEIISEIYNDSKIILENPQINYYFLAIKKLRFLSCNGTTGGCFTHYIFRSQVPMNMA